MNLGSDSDDFEEDDDNAPTTRAEAIAADKAIEIAEKLNAPRKVSQFNKARQEAESKRLRDDAEAARALREFENSLREEEEDSFARGEDRYDVTPRRDGSRGQGGGMGFQAQFGGSRGPAGPPPSLKRKRELEQMAEERRQREADREGLAALARTGSGSRSGRRDVDFSDEDEDGMGRLSKRRSPDPKVRKPTMLLQGLPSSITEDDIRDFIPDSLKVEDVAFVTPRGPQSDRRVQSAMVATSASTPASDIDKVVTQLQNRYLGMGCYLKISRHVSALGNLQNVDASILSTAGKSAFGAMQRVEQEPSAPAVNYGRAAPPSAYEAQGPRNQKRPGGLMQVSVTAPSDIKLLKLIHQTTEGLITHGPDFEALLMSRPEVQQDEKWAWLFDSTSQGGVYYRWLIWRMLSSGQLTTNGDDRQRGPFGSDGIFDTGPLWLPPGEDLKFPTVHNLQDICEHGDYVSSDDDSDDEGEQRRAKESKGAPQLINIEDVGNTAFDAQIHYLNPYRRAKLTHYLARLPESIATLRSGDIARITHFVISNAGQGAEENVDMLISNIERPFRYSVHHSNDSESDASPDDNADGRASKNKDHSNAQLIALYAVSDVLLSSSTSGVRDAWKYRNLFESALIDRQIFERLGKLDKVHSWGRMKAEQWKRKISVVLDVWSAASVFPMDVQKGLKKAFLDPPLSAQELAAREEEERREREEAEAGMWKKAGPDTGSEKRDGGKIESGGADPVNEKQAEALQKIAALKAKLGGGTATAAKTDAEEQGKATPPSHPARRSRPTAEDLFDAPEEPVAPPPAPEPHKAAPAVPVSFSLSSSRSGAAPSAGGSRPIAGFGGFSNPARTESPKPRVTPAKVDKPTNMFGDDSDEG